MHFKGLTRGIQVLGVNRTDVTADTLLIEVERTVVLWVKFSNTVQKSPVRFSPLFLAGYW